MPRFQPSRRELLRGAMATSVVGPSIARKSGVAFRPGGAEMLKIGLVGCGGRGTGAAVNALRADTNVKLWALGDVFADQLESSLSSLSSPVINSSSDWTLRAYSCDACWAIRDGRLSGAAMMTPLSVV